MPTPHLHPRAAVGAALTALVALLAGCGGGEPVAAPSPTSTSSSPAVTSTSPATSTATTTPTLPPGAEAPAAGTCTDEKTDGTDATAAVVGCSEPHGAEIISVGTLTESYLNSQLPQATGDATVLCLPTVSGVVGSTEWGTTRLRLDVGMPDTEAWRAGARWYACRLVVVQDEATWATRAGSLVGSLAGPALVELRACFTRDGEGRTGTVACDQPHQDEAMTPVVDLDERYTEHPGFEALDSLAAELCPGVLRDFLGSSRVDIGWSVTWPEDRAWAPDGPNSLVCATWAPQPVIGTLQGIGEGALPLA